MNPPTKPTSDRVLRGGSWNSGVPSWVRAASRDTGVPAYRGISVGFRCALRVRQPRV